MTIRILTGDCRDVLRTLPEASVDSIVTDPPYELGFMGKGWDSTGIANDPAMWAECLRVLKPGGHLLAFSGTRTYHRMACAIEDAGFEIRDQIGWAYGSGFPKSLDVSKAIDKAAGAERTEVIGKSARHGGGVVGSGTSYEISPEVPMLYAPATDAARQWQGWGTALKPAWEPICVARKPLIGTVAENVLTHGTGALNIDGCRVPTDDKLGGGGEKAETSAKFTNDGWKRPWMDDPDALEAQAAKVRANVKKAEALGRWPANLIHDGSEEVLQAFPDAPGQQADESRTAPSSKTNNVYGRMNRVGEPSADSDNDGVVGFKMKPGARRLDSGSAARFFYCAKADKADRGEGNTHPTVKPADLMRYLCRLVTPRGGTVLDPFAGSGSTLLAADREGFDAIGIEMNPQYAEMARRRIHGDAPLFAEVDGA